MRPCTANRRNLPCAALFVAAAVASCLLASSAPAQERSDKLLPVIPQPREFTLKEGEGFSFDRAVVIALGDPNCAEDRLAAETLQGDVRSRFQIEVPIKAVGHVSAGARVVLIGMPGRDPSVREACRKRSIAADETLGPEGYVLDADGGGVVVAATASSGVFYGVQTLRQLVKTADGAARVRGVSIRDWPVMRYRCVQDDVSRGPIPTMDYFKYQIRTLSEYKINMFCLYVEHVFKFEKHPKIAPAAGHLTAADIRELVAYGRKYHVELLPQIQSFGHQYHVLKHPEYEDIRETPRGGGVFCPLVERTYEVLGDFYSEYLPCFDSKFIHVGCDETQELGTGRSKEKAQEIGVDMLYLQHMTRLLGLLKPYGKRPMFWGDIALHYRNTLAPKLSRDYIVMNWTYGGADSFEDRLKVFADAGFDQFVCPGISCWSMIFPDYINARRNIANFVRDGAKYNALGMLNTAWDDDGENLTNWNWYGFLFSADCAWRPGEVTDADFDAVFPRSFYGIAGDDVSKAVILLSECNKVLGVPGASDSIFWEDPFTGKSPVSAANFWARARKLHDMANEALAILETQRPKVARNAETFDFLTFPARRFAHLARKFIVAHELGQSYRGAFDKADDRALVERALAEGILKLEQLKTDLYDLREEYARLWLQENRPYWLDRILARYDGLARTYANKAEQLQKTLNDYRVSAALPEPEVLQLAERSLAQRKRVAARMDAPKAFAQAEWWNSAWRCRALVKLQNGNAAKSNYPVEVQFNFADLLGQARTEDLFDEKSVRVVEYDGAGKVKGEVACQLDKAENFDKARRPTGRVVWIADGELPPRMERWFYVYFDVEGGMPKPTPEVKDPIRTYDAECRPKGPHPEGSKWVENSRYKILLGRQGGHLYIWEVKALNNLDITHPGETSWAGFNDTGRVARDEILDLVCEASGPVLVRYRAGRADGFHKTLNFYRDLPLVETHLGFAVNFFWDYDNARNMVEGRPRPGRYAFSNGEEDFIPLKPGELSLMCKSPCFWGVRYREDGLATGLVTPDDLASHRVGPGGGMGGCGIEGGRNPVAHFVSFADVVAEPKKLAETVQRTYAVGSQPQVFVAAAEKRP